ncbi:family 43 glycosylhydrolase [Carnobacterium gallinarum]|uniref:family 43 glycosylhydrolase n=1 Tax=Carnobacterium gallinarum TaxID=2749 RepID=UPI00068E3906|nr:family 43 glycosylhydrolase [Carnobacterium gallinarum]
MYKKLTARRTRNYSCNPFIQSIFTADPSAHVWPDGRLYVYPSRDMDPPQGCDKMDYYHVFSTEDMVNWRDEGEILNSSEVSWGRDSGGFMWAPDCAYKNGKYYFYFPHPSEEDWNASWKIGIAVSDSPIENFKDAGYIEGLGGFAMIDPAVFVDDDGRAYLYYGGGGHCEGGELSDDMLSLKTKMHEMRGLVDFHEAAWVFKRNGLYYLTYSDNHHGNNHLRYAISENPLGPWEHKGIYLAPTNCETSHGSVVEYKGNWYAFYHSDDLSNAGILRSICWDPIEFNEDGTMNLVVQTRNGRSGLPVTGEKVEKPLVIYPANEAKNLIEAKLILEEAAFNQECLQNFISTKSTVTFENIEGFEGGNVNLGIYYGTPEKLAKLNLVINGEWTTLINLVFTGSLQTFDGYANVTVKLKPGKVNSIELTGGNGELSLEAISVENYQTN